MRRGNVVKYNIQIKERGVPMKDMSAQKQVCSIGTGGEPAEAMRERSWEYGLPPYLQHDLDAYKEGLAEGSSLLDCLWGELYGSINIAEINDGAIVCPDVLITVPTERRSQSNIRASNIC